MRATDVRNGKSKNRKDDYVTQSMEEQFPLIQVMDQEGQLLDESYKDEITQELCEKFLAQLKLMRKLDEKLVNMQRQGRIGTYPLFGGQEAAQVGSAYALDDNDWMFPTYRDHAAMFTFTNSFNLIANWNGRVEGNIDDSGKKVLPPSVPIATQLPISAGIAMASHYKGERDVTICYFGDGATSEGDFHEGMNFAAVFNAPVVFFNQNNHYAISVPIWKQMKSETIAQKSIAYGMKGKRIDGNDIFAVYFETKKSMDAARNGEGPTLIEAVTWRYGAHTTADDPTKYRDNDVENEKHRLNDPIDRLEKFMKLNGFLSDGFIEKIEAENEETIEAAVKAFETIPKPNVDDIYDHMFEENPWPIEAHKESYKSFLEKGAK